MTFVRIRNLIFDPSRVLWVEMDEHDINKVQIRFLDGSDQWCLGSDAADAWAFFDKDQGWKDKDATAWKDE